MMTLAAIAAAFALYITASGFLVGQVKQQQARLTPWLLNFAVCAIVFHGIAVYGMIFTPAGFNFGFFTALTFIFFTVNALVLISSLKKPLHTLFIFLFPLSAVSLACALMIPADTAPLENISTAIAMHILLSVIAYSLLTIAALQATVLAYQNYKLHRRQLSGVIRVLPPLQTMEQLLFELLWLGEIILTLAIATGFIYLEDIFAQHLAHKTAFSLIAWVIYAILLWGRHTQGWRGNTAIRWALGGFSALMLAYFGSKLVLELILGLK